MYNISEEFLLVPVRSTRAQSEYILFTLEPTLAYPQYLKSAQGRFPLPKGETRLIHHLNHKRKEEKKEKIVLPKFTL